MIVLCAYTGCSRIISFGGIFYFENNMATMLLDSIEDVEKIDIERARRSKERAEEKLKVAQSESDIRRAQIALKKAINRIQAYGEYDV